MGGGGGSEKRKGLAELKVTTSRSGTSAAVGFADANVTLKTFFFGFFRSVVLRS